MSERTLVVSATNVLARGFLVVPTDRKSREGKPVNGLFALARAVRRAVEHKPPARAVAVIEADAPPKSWPPILVEQIAALPALCEALGLAVVRAKDERGMVASYAKAALDAGHDVTVTGMDKRFAQLVGERLWWYDANKDVRYTPEIVFKRFGVGPDKVAEWLGLVGDDDTLPGVTGIGAKGATTLLEKFGTVAKALEDPDSLGTRLSKALKAGAAEEIPRELARAKLATDRPLPVPLDELSYRAPSAATLNPHLEALGFVELLASDGDETAEAAVVESPDAFAAYLAKAKGTIAIDERAGGVNEAPHQAAGARREAEGRPIAIDLVMEDDGSLAGVALADSERAYVPRTSAAWPALAAWLSDAKAPKLAHDEVSTTVELHRAGVRVANIAGDTMAASHLNEPSNWAPHDLAVVAKLVLGRALPDDDTVRGTGKKRKSWAQLPPERTASVTAGRAGTVADLWAKLSPRIAKENLAEYRALADVLVRMEETGILVDLDELAGAEADFVRIGDELQKEIDAFAGHTFNVNSSPQLGKVLFEELKLPVVSHTKTGWSTSIEALTRIEHAHPIVSKVLRWRLLRRMRDNWIESLRRAIHPDGRVHSRFLHARSFSGDLINMNPDLSRVPGRTPEMQRIRRAFVPPKGHVLVSVDFHQLGLYVLAHLSKDPALCEPLRRGDDMHRLTAAAVLDKKPEDVTLDERQLGKVVNFATFAGQGVSALGMQLGIEPSEARDMIARFDRRYALVREFQERQFHDAKTKGYVTLISGRRWPIGGLESLDSMLLSYAERLARRATHEGSVADVSRRALLLADQALRKAGLRATPVHHIVDEALFDIPESEMPHAATIAADAMRSSYAPLEVPLVVGIEVGHNWADLVPIKKPQ